MGEGEAGRVPWAGTMAAIVMLVSGPDAAARRVPTQPDGSPHTSLSTLLPWAERRSLMGMLLLGVESPPSRSHTHTSQTPLGHATSLGCTHARRMSPPSG